MRWPTKHPDETLDFSLNWAQPLALDGASDAISAVTWTIPGGLTKQSQAVADGIATVFLSGGVDGTDYEIGCSIVTSGGRTLNETVKLRVAA